MKKYLILISVAFIIGSLGSYAILKFSNTNTVIYRYYTSNDYDSNKQSNTHTFILDEYSFNKLSISTVADIEYVPTKDSCRIEIEGNEKVMEVLKIYENEGTLYVRMDSKFKRVSGRLRLRIYCLPVDYISLSGVENFVVTSEISQEDFTLINSGVGSVTLAAIKAKNVNIITTGTASVYLDSIESDAATLKSTGTGNIMVSKSGKTNSLIVYTSGTGNIDISQLVYKNIIEESSGTGNIIK